MVALYKKENNPTQIARNKTKQESACMKEWLGASTGVGDRVHARNLVGVKGNNNFHPQH